MIVSRDYQVTYGLQTPGGQVSTFQAKVTATSYTAAAVRQFQELWQQMCHSAACQAAGHLACQEDPSVDVWNFWVADENGRPVWAEEPDES